MQWIFFYFQTTSTTRCGSRRAHQKIAARFRYSDSRDLWRHEVALQLQLLEWQLHLYRDLRRVSRYLFAQEALEGHNKVTRQGVESRA